MKFQNILIACCITVCLCACESLVNDLDEDKLPKVQSKLAVSCYISPQTPVIEVRVTESQPIFGSSNYDPIFIVHADVILAGDGREVKIPYNDSTYRYQIDSSAFKILAGHTYTLSVADGRRFVKATCTIPLKAPNIKDLSYELFPNAFSTDSAAHVNVSWEDIKGEKNYYSVRGYYIAEETAIHYDEKTQDVSPFRYINKIALYYNSWEDNLYNDTNLDGISFNAPEIRFGVSSNRIVTYQDKKGTTKSFYNDPKISELQMEVLNIDENYYKFYRSIVNSGNQDNPFVEPTLTFTNVEGGLGCFGGFNMAIKKIKP
jgi:hypothetical protein